MLHDADARCGLRRTPKGRRDEPQHTVPSSARSTWARKPRVCCLRRGSTAGCSTRHFILFTPCLELTPRFETGVAQRAHRFLIDQALEQFPAFCRTTRSRPGGSAFPDPALEIVEDLGLADGILAATARHNADMLIIGRGVIQGPLGRLRTIAHHLIRHSHCGVLSV